METSIKFPKSFKSKISMKDIMELMLGSFCCECGDKINAYAVENHGVKSVNCWECQGSCGVRICDTCYNKKNEEEDENDGGFLCDDCGKCENEGCDKRATEVREYGSYQCQVCKDCYEELKEMEESDE